jgi:hypothetical protein
MQQEDRAFQKILKEYFSLVTRWSCSLLRKRNILNGLQVFNDELRQTFGCWYPGVLETPLAAEEQMAA